MDLFVPDPVPFTKKNRPPLSTGTLHYLKKLVSLTTQDLEETVGKGLLVTDQVVIEVVDMTGERRPLHNDR